MDGFAFADRSTWRIPVQQQSGYNAGNALGWLYLSSKQASTNHFLMGRLYLAKSGWLLLSVPNALVRGVFDALNAPGAQLPLCGLMNVPNEKAELLNAHISVMTADEVNRVGADNIHERGHMFGYSLGALKEVNVSNIDGISKVWAISVSSPQLTALRKNYGLSAYPKDKPLHITVGVRQKRTVAEPSSRGELKAAEDLLPGGAGDNKPDSEFDAAKLETGVKHEREHTDNDQIAKEIAKDHLSEEPAYYEEHEAKKAEQVTTDRPRIIDELLAAKEHSDAGRYAYKNDIVQKLMTAAPRDWEIDDDKPKYKGVTHLPTKFKLHIDPAVIPAGVVKKDHEAAAEIVKRAARRSRPAPPPSVYMRQLANSWRYRGHRLPYDSSKTVYENIHNQMVAAKERGDFIQRSKRNHELYLSSLDPQYRHRLALDAMNGRLPVNPLDTAIERYGDGILSQFLPRG